MASCIAEKIFSVKVLYFSKKKKSKYTNIIQFMLHKTLIFIFNFCVFRKELRLILIYVYSATLLSRSTLNCSLEIVSFMSKGISKGYKDKKSLRCTIKLESSPRKFDYDIKQILESIDL